MNLKFVVNGAVQVLCSGSDSPANGTDIVYIGNAAAGTALRHTASRHFAIDTYSTGGAWLERVRVERDGNVGIGTTSPSDKLHVIGNIRAGNYTGGGGSFLMLSGDLPGYSAGAYPTLKSDGNIYISANGKYSGYIGDSANALALNRYSDGAVTVYCHPGSTSYFTGGSVAFGATTAAGGGQVYVAPTSAGTKGLVVRAAATPTANIVEVQNSSGTNLVYVDPTGDLVVGSLSAGTFPTGALAPLHVTRSTTAVSTAIAAWPTAEPETQTHARVVAYMSDGGNGGTATVGTGTTNIVQFGEYYTGRVVLMPLGAGSGTPADQNSGAGRDIMLLGGKSDNSAGKTGGRVFIQGGTGYAGAYGTNFGNVVLQANGGGVGIGTSSPVTTGLDIRRLATDAGTGQLMISNPNDSNTRLNIGYHTSSSYAFINSYTSSLNSRPLILQEHFDGRVGLGAITSPGAKLEIAVGTNTAKGLIVKGAASQSANLQEWQNSSGTALATVDASGGAYFPYIASPLQTDSYYCRRKTFARTVPTTVGNYVEITRVSEYASGMLKVRIATTWNSGEAAVVKEYSCAFSFGNLQGTIQPILQYSNSGANHDVELEAFREGAPSVVLRLRRSKGTVAIAAYIQVEEYAFGGSYGLEDRTGTGTSSFGGYNLPVDHAPRLLPSMKAVDPPGSSGNGTSVTLAAGTGMGTGTGGSFTIAGGNGATSGAGGSIILQPGAQATSGGDGSIRFVNPSNTGQYMSVAVSSTQVVFSLTGIADSSTNIQINHNVYLPGKALWSGAATIGSFYIQGSTLRATNGTSTQFGSSNGTSTDNINYIWMRQDGHIAWYGDVGLRRDNVGILTVTNGSTGGGSLAYKSNTTNISAATNDLVLNGSAFQRLNCTTACNLTGVAPPSGSHIDGRMMRIYNVGTANLTLKHNSTSSAVANRFCCVQAVDIILAPRDYAELIYDGTDGGLVAGQNNPCWRVA